jgi:hypothetical protein
MMLAIKSQFEITSIEHEHIRSLVIERFAMLRRDFPESYDPARHGWFLIIGDGDVLDEAIQAGCPPLLLDADDVPFGDDDYFNPYEFCVDHGDCFELVRVISDYGEAVTIFVPKSPFIHPSLWQLCQTLSAIPK